MNKHVIAWFRKDLRIEDNIALAAAIETGLPVIALYIHAPDEEADWQPGEASNWWLHHALESLGKSLEKYGSSLVIRRGPAHEALLDVCRNFEVTEVFWNRRYEPAVIARDTALRKQLREQGIEARSYASSLLFEPHEIENRSGKPFRVFTPFWKHLRSLPVAGPVKVDAGKLEQGESQPQSESLTSLELLPQIPWDRAFYDHWNPSLEGAASSLSGFVDLGVEAYRNQRDLPGVEGTSRLSPYLHFGQVGPRQVWQQVQQSASPDGPGAFTFLSEIAWREFAYHLLYHFPETPEQALNRGYSRFPWEPDKHYLQAWQSGQTGYPIVDAGMRQLWQSGWMHNRIRMVAASFLVKHLLQPWQAGARWFWDTLVDADLASNTMGWQWTAGCGADAAPYFRIFNPMIQGAKFDPDGAYVRRYVPELKNLPSKYIHQPWEASAAVLGKAGVSLGDNYPEPVIGHREGRERALGALALNKEINAHAGR